MIGMDKFVELLEGAESMDRHFLKAPPAENMPVLLALLGVWYINFKKASSHAILPYDNYLRYFPEYMQQLDMESNGKRVSREGDKLDIDTSPVVWGTAGTNGQHAYFQLLHQGSQLIPADFILVKESHNPLGENHELLLTNGIAQMEALMKGRTREKVYSEMQKKGLPEEEIKSTLPYKVFPGNRPSTAIVLDKVTPKSLGALIALYEHKVFTQGVIWGLNSFDQWGVEYGKELASVIKNEVDKGLPFSAHDSSTRNLIEYMFPKI
jgi:glucose-6-phosphate isomerase